ncbi:MAG TPA: NUDIX hydrolase [Solirubrobacteraceae bacterium]|nr:NUDIX hydrolase [Solirubrobacteraceae bacterium]
MERLKTRTVYENNWLKVREDTVLQDGKEAPYGVVERADGAIVIPLAPSGLTVMLEQARHPTNTRALEFPMGSVNRGEKPEVAARRELFEECQLRVEALTPVGMFFPVPALMAQRAWVYLARIAEDEIQHAVVADDTDDIVGHRILPLIDISALIVSGDISDGFTLGALALALGKGFVSLGSD